MSILYGVLGLLANTFEAAAVNPQTKILSRCIKLLFLGFATTLVISIFFKIILNNLKPNLSSYKQYLVSYVGRYLSENRLEAAFNSIQQINQILTRSMNSARSEYDSELQETDLNGIKNELMTMYILKKYCNDEGEPKIEFISRDLSSIFTDVNSGMLDYYYHTCVKHIWSIEDSKGAYGKEKRASIFIDNIHDETLRNKLQQELIAKTQSYVQERADIREAYERVADNCFKYLEKRMRDPKVIAAFSEVMSAERVSHTVKIEVVEGE